MGQAFMRKPFITVSVCVCVCVWVKALSISFEVRFFWRVLHERFTRKDTVVWAYVCICVPFFLLACGSCSVVKPTIRMRPAWLKSLSALFFSLVFSSTLPFLFPFPPPLSGLQGLRTQAPKDYQTHPFQKHWALQLLSHLTVCMCVWKRTFEQQHSRSHTFYPLCLLGAKKVEEEKQKERWKEESGGRGEADWVIAAHQHREGERAKEQSLGLQPASATLQLLCRELT